MPTGKRRQWVEVFNSVMERMHDEGAAMRQANGVVKKDDGLEAALTTLRSALKEAGKTDDEVEAEVKAIAEKCGMEMPAVAVEVYQPFGGATSFDELDDYMEAQHLGMHVHEVTYQFQRIIDNILSSDLDMTEKGTRITAAASELQNRADNPPPMMKEGGGLKAKLASLFSGKAVDPNVGGGVNRANIPAQDFAGRDRSFPIVTPQDVADAARSIGRAGSGNFSTDQLKRNIIRIAKRKGPTFVAKLPKAWQDEKEASEDGAFAVFKDAAGSWRWFAVYSNHVYDRDGEVFPDSEHRDYVQYVERTKDYPDLWLWHTPGSKAGKVDFVDVVEGFALASGGFDAGMEDVAEALAQRSDLGVSHGFHFRELDQNKAYRGYRTFEVSPLPRERAANWGTAFYLEDLDMELTKEKRDFLVSTMGEERVKRIEANLGALKKELDESGAKVAWKDFADAIQAPPAAPAADAKPITVPASEAAPKGAGGEQPSQEEGMKALRGIITEAVKETLAPIEQRLAALEKSDEEKIAARFEPRIRPNGQRPTETNQPLDGRNAAAKEAQAAADEAAGDGTSGGIDDWYKRTLGLTLLGGTAQALPGQPAAPAGTPS